MCICNYEWPIWLCVSNSMGRPDSSRRRFQTAIALKLYMQWTFKDLNSTVAKRGSVSIGLMISDGAIWFRYQRAVLIR